MLHFVGAAPATVSAAVFCIAVQLEIERLQQRNQRLQATGEVTEKAAAEFVDQKMHEVSFLQNELASQLAGTAFPFFVLFVLVPVSSAQYFRLTCIIASFSV